MNKPLVCSEGYKQNPKSGKCEFIEVIGYSSHGKWSTFGELEEIEQERGNPFTTVDYPKNTPAIWLCPTKRLALRYSHSVWADDWDRLSDISQPLTGKEKEALKYEIETIRHKPTDIVVLDDGEEGYLLLRK